MNLELIKIKEAEFLNRYPGGFQNEEILKISKKHGIHRLTELMGETLREEDFEFPERALENLTKLLTRCSLVSVFEKTAFKNHIKSLPVLEQHALVDGFRDLLHGNQGAGFEYLVRLLQPYKMAKWTVITALPYIKAPQQDLVIKPTTVKAVIQTFDLEGLKYQSLPDYDFYQRYREQFLLLKEQTGPEISKDNGGFGGFLMFALGMFE